MKQLLTLIAITLLVTSVALGDSPITSTPFHEAYSDLPMVQRVLKSKKMDATVARYLMNPKVSLGERLAVSNAFGWNFNGQSNGKQFAKSLNIGGGTWFMASSWRELPADQLIILAYLNSLDDYFNVSDEVEQAKWAREKNPNNASLAMVAALIEGQSATEAREDWPEVWEIAKRASKSSSNDRFRPKARKIIMDYMKLYKED